MWLFAEVISTKVDKLIISASFAANNQSLIDLASTDAKSLLGPSLILTNRGLTLSFNHENIADFFPVWYHSTKIFVVNNFQSRTSTPFVDHVNVTEANFGSVDKYYIGSYHETVFASYQALSFYHHLKETSQLLYRSRVFDNKAID